MRPIEEVIAADRREPKAPVLAPANRRKLSDPDYWKVAKIVHAARLAAGRGEPKTANPYDPASAEYRAWLSGWLRGPTDKELELPAVKKAEFKWTPARIAAWLASFKYVPGQRAPRKFKSRATGRPRGRPRIHGPEYRKVPFKSRPGPFGYRLSKPFGGSNAVIIARKVEELGLLLSCDPSVATFVQLHRPRSGGGGAVGWMLADQFGESIAPVLVMSTARLRACLEQPIKIVLCPGGVHEIMLK